MKTYLREVVCGGCWCITTPLLPEIYTRSPRCTTWQTAPPWMTWVKAAGLRTPATCEAQGGPPSPGHPPWPANTSPWKRRQRLHSPKPIELFVTDPHHCPIAHGTNVHRGLISCLTHPQRYPTAHPNSSTPLRAGNRGMGSVSFACRPPPNSPAPTDV
jgi:hypothetical protein